MKGVTIWFTGLSGSGKSTIAQIVYKELKKAGYKVEILDGDVIRTNLSKGLGFSKEGRDENIKRVGFVCDLLTRNGVIAIAVCISPYREIRDFNRKRIGNFVEVYTKCSLDECIKRDPKGNYKKALAGEIKNYTGIDDPYEEPENPEVMVETDKTTPEECARVVLDVLVKLHYLEKKDIEVSSEEEEKIKQRLKSLGYL
ncbi:MAG: adenylyl-sulfate kinase [Candidatus Omnitrophica bacterium]|nr:adenylyl-sulfate kinase [Candidatus Omnitrophota bacterium]